MKRKEIRKILKGFVYNKMTDYNGLRYAFVDIGIHGTKMSKEFESLVDEVDKMIQEKHEKDKS